MANNLEKEFVLEGLKLRHRTDGRGLFACRPLEFEFGTKDAYCIARLGGSVAYASVIAELDQPMGGRPSEGTIKFNVDIARAQYSTLFKNKDPVRVNHYMIELGRFIERSFRESKAIDLESLCVQAGRRVWHLQVDLKILNDDGNIPDVLGYAALGVLRVYRRPDVSIDSSVPGGLVVHSLDDREGVPLTLHHFPVCLTFASFDEGDVIVVDPSSLEESTCDGRLTISVTPQGELCAVQKAQGYGMSQTDVMQCIQAGIELAESSCRVLEKALKSHAVARVASRVRRTAGQDSPKRVGFSSESGPAPMNIESLDPSVRDAMHAADEPIEDDDDDDDDNEQDDAGGKRITMDTGEAVCPGDDSHADGSKEQVLDEPTQRKYTSITNSSGKNVDIYKETSDMVPEQDDAMQLKDAFLR
ncbi:hypothetical protein M9434_001524 [Picochlorum sp. BPE23]|nr:hypothetical protein M9434_001524 [Picochlorum sp. BPE23]